MNKRIVRKDHEWHGRVVTRSLAASFVAGAAGGSLVTGAILITVATSGWFGPSTGRVTVQEAPIMPGVSRRAPELTMRQIYRRDALGIVSVNATGVSEGQSPAELLKGEEIPRGPVIGSGIEVDGNGTILTNWHVVANATKVTVGFAHDRTIAARVVGKDPSDDLAVLRITVSGLTLHPLRLGNSSEVQVGDPVVAIGDPFGLERTLTTGVVSALQRRITSPSGALINEALQTDAPVNPGSSGGPLLNVAGEVIGVTSQIETNGRGGGSVGIAFAIPINTAKGKLPALEKDWAAP